MIFVGIGGVFGALSRFILGKWIAGKIATVFPLGTWIINLSGSLLLGFLASLHLKGMISDWSWLLWGSGFLGAYTTFSTFGYETVMMLQKRETREAVFYVLSSLVLGVSFAFVGSVISNYIM